MPSVVCIHIFDRSGHWIGWGSGFFIAPGRILTAAHVIYGAYSLRVTSDEVDSKYPFFYQNSGITILKVDKYSDLAVLGVTSVDRPSLELEKDDSSLHVGQSVVEFGNPVKCKVMASTGIIRGLDKSLSPPALILSAAGGHGSSGGPVCNGKGNVIGVWRAGKDDVPLYGLAVYIPTINTFLKTPDHARELPAAFSIVPEKPGFWKRIWTVFSKPVGTAANWLWVAAGIFIRIIGLVVMVCLGPLVLLILSLSVAKAIKKAYRTGLLAAMLLAASAIWIVILRASPSLVTALFEKKGLIWLVILAPVLPVFFFFMLRRRLRGSKRTFAGVMVTAGTDSSLSPTRIANQRRTAVKRAK
jgi:hypothetical protein